MATFNSYGVGGDHPERVTIKTVATINSQDNLNNKSNVTIKVYGYYNYNQYTPPNPTVGNQYLSIDGTKVINRDFNPDFTGTSESSPQLLMEWTGDISHNADGSKTLAIKVYQDCNNVTTLDYLYGSHSWVLTTIPRNSKITSFPDFVISDGVTVTAPRETGTFKNIFRLKVGTTLIHQTGELLSNSFTFTPAICDQIYALIPSATSTKVIAEVVTMSGKQQIGAVSIDTAVARVGNIKPTIGGFTAVETVSSISALNLGALTFLQNYSKVKFSITGQAGVKSSTIVEFEIKFNGVARNSASFTSGVYNISGENLKATARVKDSRGIWSNTITLLLDFIPYANPSIGQFTGFRSDVSGVSDVVGFYVNTTLKGSVSSINGKNKLSYKLYYKLKTELDADYKLIGTYSNTGVVLNTTKVIGDGTTYFEPIFTYDIKLEVIDGLNNTSKALIRVGTGKVPFSFGREGVGAGKVWEQGALDIGAGGIYVSGSKLNIIVAESYSTSGAGWIYWRKWDNGIMEIWQVNERASATGITTASGAMYRSGSYSYIHPQEFINNDVMVQISASGAPLNSMVTVNAYNITSTAMNYMYFSNISGSPTNLVTTYYLVGKWK